MASVPRPARESDKLTEVSQLAVSRVSRTSPRSSRADIGTLFIFLDGLVVVGSGLLAYSLRAGLGKLLGVAPLIMSGLHHFRLLVFLVIYALLTVTCNAAQGLYSAELLHSADVARSKLTRAFLLSSLMAVMVVFVANEKWVPRLMFATTAAVSWTAMVMLRYVAQRVNVRRLHRGNGASHVLIVGAGEIGQAFDRHLRTHSYLGKRVCGFVDADPQASPLWLGTPDDLPRLLKEHFIDEIYFTSGASRELIIPVALQARQERISLKVVPDLYGGLALGAGFTWLGDVPLLELNHQPIPALGLFIKRVMDLAGAGFILVAAAPLMLVTALAIKLSSPGPVIYSARRVGRKGREFRCHKFRTMVADADKRKEELRRMNERNGATFKITNDPRITPLGRLLRKFSIDELPQLFNVLHGDMSLVGPRPHPVDDYHRYGLEDLRRLDVLPGVTGLWQVSARSDPSFEKNVELDLEYINNWNLSLDVKILLKTILVVLSGSGR